MRFAKESDGGSEYCSIDRRWCRRRNRAGALKALKLVGQAIRADTFDYPPEDVGHAIDKVGVPLPQATLVVAKQSDAVSSGAGALPKWRVLMIIHTL